MTDSDLAPVVGAAAAAHHCGHRLPGSRDGEWHRGPEKFAKLLQLIGTPSPLATAWLVTTLEVLGGIAIIIGAFVLVASIPLFISMVVAMLTIHVHYGFSAVNTVGLTATGPVFGPPGYEINLLYMCALVALAIAGPGVLSVAPWLRSRDL